ncbi:MAG: biotin/lipoyl-binding protein [candidate division Zixibacteria bacterium]|nr:biotin/lipoyl-binding protein [candidate division Zixibacteria bacterium]
MELEFSVEEQTYKLEVDHKDGKYLVRLGDKQYNVDSQSISENCLSLLVDGKAYTVFIAEGEGKKYISLQGEQFCVEEAKAEIEARSLAESDTLKGAPTIASPMPGKVVKILVGEKDKVEKGQGLVIVEAMKMENEIRSPSAGVVKKINFKEGDLVDAAELIIELESAEEK